MAAAVGHGAIGQLYQTENIKAQDLFETIKFYKDEIREAGALGNKARKAKLAQEFKETLPKFSVDQQFVMYSGAIVAAIAVGMTVHSWRNKHIQETPSLHIQNPVTSRQTVFQETNNMIIR